VASHHNFGGQKTKNYVAKCYTFGGQKLKGQKKREKRNALQWQEPWLLPLQGLQPSFALSNKPKRY
jgi:hypothetical protein